MLKSLNSNACIFKMVKQHRSEVWRDIFIFYFYTLKPDDIAVGLAGYSDEVIYPTLIPVKISGVLFVV